MENKNEIILKKIPLKIFINVLTDAWNQGADFVDIIGQPDQIQDNIGIAIKQEYYSKDPDDVEEEEEEYDIEVELDPTKDLDDEDLNQLL
ncbi:MAG: hypothetical protein EBR30_01500 [Cytophagia bacterium]|nr:hypothetical protein [Cytophagia bacterium]